MGLPKRADGVITGTDWDTVIDAIEARLGSDAVGDLLMADAAAIKTGIVDDDYYDLEVVDNDTNALVRIGRVQGASNPYLGLGSSSESKFYADGTITLGELSENWDAGAFEIRAETFISDIAIGTAPLTVTSTTVVPNLNVDQVDGYDLNQGVSSGDSPTFANITDNGLTASRLVASDGAKQLVSSNLANWVTGTANEITVTDDGDGTITLDVPDAVTLVNLTVTDITIGANTLTTAEWAYLDDINQSVATGSSVVFASAQISDLTSGRVTFAGADGELQDDADFTFSTDTLTVTKIAGTEFTGTVNMAGQTIDNVGVFNSNDANPASAGVIRLGNTEQISWRNPGDSDDVTLTLNVGTVMVFDNQSGNMHLRLSSKTNDSIFDLDSGTDGTTEESNIYFSDAASRKWQITKDTSNNLKIYDDINNQDILELDASAATVEATWSNVIQGHTQATTTLGNGDTTFAVSSDFMVITGDAGANTVATITGGVDGQILTLLFVDDKVTITDTDAHTADTVDLSAGFTSADDTTLQIIYDGTSWYEVGRSVN